MAGTLTTSRQAPDITAVNTLIGSAPAQSAEQLNVDLSGSVSDAQAEQNEQDTEISNKAQTGKYADLVDRGYNIPKPYSYKPKYGPFTLHDFQFGSTRLTVPPTIITVDRVRDVQTVPVLRSGSLAGRA